MKPIQPITLWVNGQNKTANVINIILVNDNLKNNALFYYELLETVPSEENAEPINKIVGDGNISILDAEYEAWGTNADINQDAYNIVASKLGITLV